MAKGAVLAEDDEAVETVADEEGDAAVLAEDDGVGGIGAVADEEGDLGDVDEGALLVEDGPVGTFADKEDDSLLAEDDGVGGLAAVADEEGDAVGRLEAAEDVLEVVGDLLLLDEVDFVVVREVLKVVEVDAELDDDLRDEPDVGVVELLVDVLGEFD